MQKNHLTTSNSRSQAVRMGALALAVLTMFGMTELGRHGTSRTETTGARSVAQVFQHAMEKENETTRMPVRFDDGLRAPTIGGI
jgi:putative IMPACT (imprinted ancient) family translation regulator